MRVRHEELAGALSARLAPVYLVASDELLLVEEAAAAILAAAEAAGFSERTVLFVESGFKWGQLTEATQSMSLFAERRVIDVRVPGAKFDREASDTLRALLEAPDEDVVLLIRAAGLDRRQQNSAWFKAIDAAGVVVQCAPVSAAALPRWVTERARRAGLAFQTEALGFFCEHLEGNLLAAAQALERLQFAGLPQPMTQAAVAGVVENASHYDTFELIDAVFAADPRRVARMVATLQAEGASIFAILGAFVSQMRSLQSGRGWMPKHRERHVPEFRRPGGDDRRRAGGSAR